MDNADVEHAGSVIFRHVHRYMRPRLARILQNASDPTAIISHRMRLDEASGAFRVWRDKQDGCTTIVLQP